MKKKLLIISVLVFFVLFFLFLFYVSAPKNFPVGFTFKIEEGKSLRGLSGEMRKENLIRSRLAFESLVILYGGERRIKQGHYLFEKKVSVFKVAKMVARGDYHVLPVKITIPEGFTVNEIAEVYSVKLPEFNKEEFLSKAKEMEGYLFPDTYFLLPGDNIEEAIDLMKNNYEKKMTSVRPKIEISGKTEEEIIIMASLIEKEAKGDDDRNLISGILWKRMKVGMPLQVDAAPETYNKKGLPENPIANPGMLSIIAAINPEPSVYLYYLHDKNGMIHYARSFEEHRRNINKYLR